MSIYLYQIQYDDASRPSDTSDFKAFDVRDNPEFLKREMAHMIRFYDDIVSKGSDDDYYGLFSPKFNEKSGLSSAEVISFVKKNLEADVCLFNPFPMTIYKNLNVWRQGEANHPDLIRLANQMFNKAGFDFDAAGFHRNSLANTVYCNYWVAKKTFFDGFILFVKKMDHAINDMPEHMRAEYFCDAKYITKACYYPFLFERLLSTFLISDLGINYTSEPYVYQAEPTGARLGKVEKAFFQHDGMSKFNQWELQAPSVDEVAKKVELLRAFLNPKLTEGLALPIAIFFRSLIKSLNCIRMVYFLNKQF